MLTCRLALVTGAGSGLGKELCKLLAKHHIALLMTGRDEKSLEELSSLLRNQVEVHVEVADLKESASRARLIKRMQVLKPDLVINNAGFGLYGDSALQDTASQLEMLDVNVRALTEISIEAAKIMVKERLQGVIMNISSAAAFFTYPSFAVYAASKAFVKELSQSLDAELKPFGVRVLCSCPGQIATPFRFKAAGKQEKKQRSRDFLTLSTSHAAQLILKQIAQKRGLEIIDWRYKLLIALSYLLPKNLLAKQLQKEIQKRLSQQPEEADKK